MKYNFERQTKEIKNVETKEMQNIQKANSKMANVNLIISIITLNVNGLNISMERQRLSDLILKKQDSTTCYLQKTYFILKNRYRLEDKEQKRYAIQMVAVRELEKVY